MAKVEDQRPAEGPKGDSLRDAEPVFFYEAEEPNGELSQWYMSTFTVTNSWITSICGIHLGSEASGESMVFNCTEQFVMYCKAALFSDVEKQRCILEVEDPRLQRAAVRAVTGYDETKWSTVEDDIVEMGNYAKFSQNPVLKSFLLATGGRELVEMSKFERVMLFEFGATVLKPHQNVLGNRHHWGGTRLGKVLEKVRAMLMSE